MNLGIDMEEDSRKAYLKALGARILSEANDLKRTPEALAKELGWEFEAVKAVIAGAADVEAAHRLVHAMCETYPVSLADLWLEPDDTEAGAKLMTAAESEASRRTFGRRDRTGAETLYYEYRDTAMSRTAPFKPEWIAQLRVVDDADPNNPDVAYNNGHLLHQITFFIGPVNFYWEVGGTRHCAELDTGDSNYITPFVPHSFTSRDAGRRGLIIAVTYGGGVRNALDDFGRVGRAAAAELAGDLRQPDAAFTSRIARYLAADSLSLEGFLDRLEQAGLDRARAEAVVRGGGADAGEIDLIARALNVRPSDLMVSGIEPDEEVVVTRRADVPPRAYPDGNRPAYQLTELARTKHQPQLRGFEVEVLGGPDGSMRHGLHEYLYNYGEGPVALIWGDGRRAELGPGDSAYIRPMVEHRFERPADAEPGRLIMIRVPGALTDPVIDELAAFPPEGRERVAGETIGWF